MKSLLETLKFTNITIGDIQSVDEMTVFPLVGPNRGNVASPNNLQFSRTTGYGNMEFKNDDERPAIVPAYTMVRGRGGQDHAMTGTGIVPRKESIIFNTACCVEQRQPGMLSGSDKDNRLDILPITLRKDLLDYNKRTKKEYGKLWSDIIRWLKGIGHGVSSEAGHLSYFYDNVQVKKALEDFAAEFEPVEGQIGAIILFSGVPVGLEIMPTNAHWDAYWKQLIRGSYTAELFRLKLLGKVKPSTLIMPEISPTAKPEEIKKTLEDFMSHLKKDVAPLLENVTIANIRTIGNTAGLQTDLLITNGGGGDIIYQEEEPIYISLVL